MEVLQFQKPYRGEFHEDQWLASRIGLLPGANMAGPDVEKEFSVERVWFERPLGYHLEPSLAGEVWDNFERRKEIYAYCPEIKIVLDMRLERERCPVPVAEPLLDSASDGDGGSQRSTEPEPFVDHNGSPINPEYLPINDASPGEDEAAFKQVHQPGIGPDPPDPQPLTGEDSTIATPTDLATDIDIPQGDSLETESSSEPAGVEETQAVYRRLKPKRLKPR